MVKDLLVEKVHLVLILFWDHIRWGIQHIRHCRHIRKYGSGGWVFRMLRSQGNSLSQNGNYIVNTLLALHKFQAKKQVFPNRN